MTKLNAAGRRWPTPLTWENRFRWGLGIAVDGMGNVYERAPPAPATSPHPRRLDTSYNGGSTTLVNDAS